MRLKAIAICVLLLLAAPLVRAQQPQSDPIAENLFPPELIMQYQQALDLSEEQKNFIKSEVRRTQLTLTEMQWRLQDEVDKMAGLLKSNQLNEGKALEQLGTVLGFEQNIKRTQFTFLIRIKNKLTPEQQARLRELRAKQPAK